MKLSNELKKQLADEIANCKARPATPTSIMLDGFREAIGEPGYDPAIKYVQTIYEAGQLPQLVRATYEAQLLPQLVRAVDEDGLLPNDYNVI